jgi:hypothetical protein
MLTMCALRSACVPAKSKYRQKPLLANLSRSAEVDNDAVLRLNASERMHTSFITRFLGRNDGVGDKVVQCKELFEQFARHHYSLAPPVHGALEPHHLHSMLAKQQVSCLHADHASEV